MHVCGTCRCLQTDYVAIYEEGQPRNNFTLVEMHCGTLSPGPFVSTRVVKVVFHSDEEESLMGFKASYQYLAQRDMGEAATHTHTRLRGREEGSVLFNDALNTFYGYMRAAAYTHTSPFEGRKQMFYLTTHSTHFIYGYMRAAAYTHTSRFEGRKEMFYLTTHSTHFIYGYMRAAAYTHTSRFEGRKEMFYLTTHSTLYLWLYGVRHKNHSDRERGNPLLPHRLLFSISSKGSFICIIPQTG